MPGFANNYATQIFHPLFLQQLSGCRSIRFMNWGTINGSTQTEWNTRTTPTFYTQEASGGQGNVAIEHMIDLANRVGADPWICVPHMATNDYIRQMARLIRQRLNPNRKVMIEYSNEVWNGQFVQNHWCGQQGMAQGLANNEYSGYLEFYPKRSGEIFQIFEQEFGNANRLVRVLASQAGNPWLSQQLVSRFVARYGSGKADALAIAAYHGGPNWFCDLAHAPQVAAMTLDQVFTVINESLDASMNIIMAHKPIADQYDLRFIGYEGGQHIVGRGGAENNEAVTALCIAANRDPRMGTMLTNLFNKWQQGGGDVLCVYLNVGPYSKYGSWGFLERQDQDISTAHKFRALRQAMGLPPNTP
jgi:hypothetical protein